MNTNEGTTFTAQDRAALVALQGRLAATPKGPRLVELVTWRRRGRRVGRADGAAHGPRRVAQR